MEMGPLAAGWVPTLIDSSICSGNQGAWDWVPGSGVRVWLLWDASMTAAAW